MIRASTAWLSSTPAVASRIIAIRSYPTAGAATAAAFSSLHSRHATSTTTLPTIIATTPRSHGSTNLRSNNHALRLFSEGDNEWKAPSGLHIPEDQLNMSFIRSSGAGGQNVNKVNSQVQIKMNLDSPDIQLWIPLEVVGRLKEQQHNRINKHNELILQVQEHRTQAQNRKAAVDKIRLLILEAWPRPKIRKLRKGVSKETKEKYKEIKQKRKSVKQNRQRVDSW